MNFTKNLFAVVSALAFTASAFATEPVVTSTSAVKAKTPKLSGKQKQMKEYKECLSMRQSEGEAYDCHYIMFPSKVSPVKVAAKKAPGNVLKSSDEKVFE